MNIPEIQDFDQMITDFLSKDETYVSHDIKFLTAAGENYASVMLAITIRVLKNGKEKDIHVVAKMQPDNKFMQKFMNVKFTVRMELGFYQTIMPTLKKFTKGKMDWDFIPDFYGGRLNLDKMEESIIMMQNLKPHGYTLLEKEKGFDLNLSKQILEKMANLHGAVIALKAKSPETFAKNIEPFFEPFTIFEMEKEFFMTCNRLVTGITKVIQEDEKCASNLNSIEKTIERSVQNMKLPKNDPKFHEDTFVSLCHCDLWVNNIMFKLNNGKVDNFMFIDWQLYEYTSVIKDIFFFLGTCVSETVFENNFNELIEYYHAKLKETLVKFDAYSEKYNFEQFQTEMKKVSRDIAFFYIMIAIPSIFPSEDDTWSAHEITEERMLAQIDVTEFCAKRIQLITRKFLEMDLL